jgi:hypothetical protein
VTGTALRVRHLAIVTGTAKTASGLTKTATPSPRKARLRDGNRPTLREAAQRASTGSPVPLPLREAASRLRDGNRLFGGLVSPRRQERQEFVDCA